MRGRVAPAAAVLAAVLALGAPGAALAAECPRTTLGDVEDEVMCPVCGTPLGLATEAPQAERERALIRRMVDDCRSKDEIKARLVAEFGDGVLATPGDDGFDLAAYLVPALAVLAGAGGVGIAAVRWRGRRPGDGHEGEGEGEGEGDPEPGRDREGEGDLGPGRGRGGDRDHGGDRDREGDGPGSAGPGPGDRHGPGAALDADMERYDL